MSPSSPTLSSPLPNLPPPSSQHCQQQQHDTTPSPPPQQQQQQQQRQQYTSSLSPRSSPRLPWEDSSPVLPHDYKRNHNYSYNSYKNENRPRSPYRDNYNDYNNKEESFSATPHDHNRRRFSAATHAPHFYPDSNLSRPNSPRQQSPPPPTPYYRRDSAHPSRRSMSPTGTGAGGITGGPASDASSQRYYPPSSSEPCRELCCVDTTRAPYHIHSSPSSSSYAVYSPSGSSRAHYYPSESSRGAPYSPDSPHTPAFSPSLHSSSSSPSSSTSPYTPTPSPATTHNPHQRVIFHDSSRKGISNASNSVNNDDERMGVDQQEDPVDYQNSSKTTNAKTVAKPFKIPRPANSFMLYRAENGKKYPGLVATELSAKLGEAWRKEPQDVRDRYEEMAEQAKRDHALKYPDYKFAPVKRGTGKRALKLAAEAIANEMAEMDAAALLISMASMAPAPSPSGSRDRDQRHYVPISRAHSTSVSATGIRSRAQRPFKVASLNKSNVPIINDANVSTPSISSVSLSNNNNSSSSHNSTEIANNSSNNGNEGTEASVNNTSVASQQQQGSRAYPQLSPPLILFREALARRSPQLASSLVAQIVINVWFGVTEELRERYEIMAESDPRFKDKSNYINHSQISGTPTTASEAMMANQIAQLLKKAAAGEQLILPHSNKRKGTANAPGGLSPASKLARIAPAPFSPPTDPASASAPARAPATDPPQDVPIPASASPIPPTPPPLSPSPIPEATPIVSAKVSNRRPSPSPFLVEAASASFPDKMATVPSGNDLATAAVVPMPMTNPNKRQTRASAAPISVADYSPSTSVASSTSTTKAPKVKKVRVEQKADEKVTPANRPIRRITRPPRYSA